MRNKTTSTITNATLDRATRGKAKHGEGSVIERNGKLHVRLSLGPIRRRTFVLPAGTTEAQAEERRRIMADMARGLLAGAQIGAGLPLLERAAEATDARALHAIALLARKVAEGEATMKPGATTTIRELGERWTSGVLSRQFPDHVKVKATSADDAATFRLYVYPVAGDVAVASFTLDHAEQIMARVPADRAQNTRRNIAVKLHRLLGLAVYPLRILASNPLPKGFVPRQGAPKAKVCLYPSEDRALLGCAEIPLIRRLFYGFLAREGMRSGEALALRWRDLDLERGSVRLDTNKTDDARLWALDPSVRAALIAWRAICEASGELPSTVFPALLHGRAADLLRQDLARAGVSRHELFETNANRQPIRVHDLRATFVTLSLANGRTETWITDRTGHRSSQMIARYRRAARHVGELNLGALAPLCEAIPELRAPSGGGRGPEPSQGPQGAKGEPQGADAVGEAPEGAASCAEPFTASTTEQSGTGSGRPAEDGAGTERIQILDPRFGSMVPIHVASGREPSAAIQIPAGNAPRRNRSREYALLQNRPTRVRIPSSPSQPNSAETQRKTPGDADAQKAGNVLADPIWIQSAEPQRIQGGPVAPEERMVPQADEKPRDALVRNLTAGMMAAVAAGDLAAARVAHEAIGKLLATPADPGEAAATVVDLAAERERRAGR